MALELKMPYLKSERHFKPMLFHCITSLSGIPFRLNFKGEGLCGGSAAFIRNNAGVGNGRMFRSLDHTWVAGSGTGGCALYGRDPEGSVSGGVRVVQRVVSHDASHDASLLRRGLDCDAADFARRVCVHVRGQWQ